MPGLLYHPRGGQHNAKPGVFGPPEAHFKKCIFPVKKRQFQEMHTRSKTED
jgi:hypothetical protein